MINLQKLVVICRYELPTNLQNFTQKDLTEVKIFQKVLGGGSYFLLKHSIQLIFIKLGHQYFSKNIFQT